MESSNSSSGHRSPFGPPDDQHQLQSHQTQVTLPATQGHAAASTSTPSSASMTPQAPRAQPAVNSSHERSGTSHTPSTSSLSEAAPTTTLWENFMASLRNVVQHDSSESASASPSSTAQANFAHQQANGAHPIDAHSAGLPHPPVFFRLPFNGRNGAPELLAFHPQPLPRRESDTQANPQSHTQSYPNSDTPPRSLGQSTGSTPSSPYPTGQPGSSTGTSPTNAHSHPHVDGHVPVAPLYVPFGASPLPFSFIYDANTQTAWPIAQMTPGSPPGGPSPDAPDSQQPRLVAGPPFRIILDVHFASPPQPEQPDPERAAKYVKQLERADAELRARMARLGLGSIGGFADASCADDQDALLGCGVCLDNYEAGDRPEWIDGPKSQDEAVVAVPCHGHHTLHAGCLRDWLAKLPPSQWSCPFCRANLNPNASHLSAEATIRSSPKAASASSAPVHTTLRDEVRVRERQRGWRCDAPACLPRYPAASCTDDGHLDLPETSDSMTADLVKLMPCRHDVHLDCLCTSMRVENNYTGATDLDAIISGAKDTSSAGPESGGTSKTDENSIEGEERDTIGKWVTCPNCRKESWAELPLRRRPQRSAPDASTQGTGRTALAQASVTAAYGKQASSTPLLQDALLDNSKASRPPQTSGEHRSSDETVDNVADAFVDPDEEAAVDAVLVSS
ncbi:related to conserved hypothetcial protein [Melanopsichium pennsylvanicum]|uniref:Related to conserved hypothetcial protein n=2 Tax=Melanopsichium pennsylvanicum TaxID=63383 RepID=A0AAJ4XTX1_9BASI|nr:putative protein [Melanopsichium pennsylvanicum 4]SNX88047.1 related to conserved hypothetcial protein [Melanopsichium pennsylvanicum]